MASHVPQPPNVQGTIFLLSSHASGRDGPVDGASPSGLQLRPSQNKRIELKQGSRLLLPGSVIQERYTTPASHVASSAIASGSLSEDDDDGTSERSSQELWRIVQKQRAPLYLLRGQDEVLGGCQKRGQRVGGLSR